MQNWIIAAVISGSLLAGCSSHEAGAAAEGPAATLTGEEWIVEDIDSGGVIDMSHVTLLFTEGGGLSGSGGCNRYSTSYETDGAGLTLGPIAATKRACAPALMTQENRFLNILGASSHFAFSDNGALIISTPDDRSITARR